MFSIIRKMLNEPSFSEIKPVMNGDTAQKFLEYQIFWYSITVFMCNRSSISVK